MTAQQEFDAKYISSTEICARLGIQRSTLHRAINAQRFPQAITLKTPGGKSQIMLWDRDVVNPYIAQWADALARSAAA